MTKRKPKICVAMSGGVDSSVAATLLTKAGYDCIGAFFVTWTEQVAGLKMCPWEQDVFDARQVCDKLGMPLYVFNFEQDYRQRVIEYFFREYEEGRTPNPDVMCNREIKFGLFLEKAKAIGADFIATGHYAQVKKNGDVCQLLRGADPNKDQSYFLYTLTQQQLQHAMFPVGHLTKPEVRKLAKKFQLPNWEKKDSQGICFLGEVEVGDFLKTRLPITPGPIVDTKGKHLGDHQGVHFYTIGQRHGLHLPGGLGVPHYVVAKDIAANTLIVSPKNEDQAFRTTTATLRGVSWVASPPMLPLDTNVKIRYRQPDQKATLTAGAKSDELTITFAEPQRSVTPGQSVVFYHGEEVVGGGVIQDQ